MLWMQRAQVPSSFSPRNERRAYSTHVVKQTDESVPGTPMTSTRAPQSSFGSALVLRKTSEGRIRRRRMPETPSQAPDDMESRDGRRHTRGSFAPWTRDSRAGSRHSMFFGTSDLNPNVGPTCVRCTKKATAACHCRRAVYCGSACREADWSLHMEVCTGTGPPRCVNCGRNRKLGMLQCACLTAVYCTRRCRQEHWATHVDQCTVKNAVPLVTEKSSRGGSRDYGSRRSSEARPKQVTAEPVLRQDQSQERTPSPVPQPGPEHPEPKVLQSPDHGRAAKTETDHERAAKEQVRQWLAGGLAGAPSGLAGGPECQVNTSNRLADNERLRAELADLAPFLFSHTQQSPAATTNVSQTTQQPRMSTSSNFNPLNPLNPPLRPM
eukprot:Hpha_TRINITY_DN6265_c0_g1::TRINITY_DN6265_c0_g1_i1::g.23568::m.23568